jgi:hypothetical protein
MRASIAGGFQSTSHRPLRAKLIFNAGGPEVAGQLGDLSRWDQQILPVLPCVGRPARTS